MEPKLSELQKWMDWVVRDPKGVAAALDEGFNEPQPRCLDWIDGKNIEDQIQRIGIYAEGYFLRSRDSLMDLFPSVFFALDSDDFDWSVAQYLELKPSTSPNLLDLGWGYPRFLATSELIETYPFIGDLAGLDWSVTEVFYSNLGQKLNPEDLERIAPEQWGNCVFQFRPSIRILKSDWAIDEVWEKEKKVPEKGCFYFLIDKKVFRHGVEIQVQRLVSAEASLLDAMHAGRTLKEALEGIKNLSPEALTEILSEWIENEWIQTILLKKIGSSPDNGQTVLGSG